MFCPHISTTLASTTDFIQCSMWLTSYLNMLSVFHVSIQGDSFVPMCHDTHKWGSLLSSKGITSCQSCQFLLKDSVHFYLLQRTQQHTWFENWQDMCIKQASFSSWNTNYTSPWENFGLLCLFQLLYTRQNQRYQRQMCIRVFGVTDSNHNLWG